MNNKERIRRFIKTNPSIEQIEEFIETEARRRIAEEKKQKEIEAEERFKVFAKKEMAEHGEEIRKWAKDESSHPMMRKIYADCVRLGS